MLRVGHPIPLHGPWQLRWWSQQEGVGNNIYFGVQWSYRGTIQQKPLYSSLHIYMKFYIAVKYYIYYILAIIYQFCMAIIIFPLVFFTYIMRWEK